MKISDIINEDIDEQELADRVKKYYTTQLEMGKTLPFSAKEMQLQVRLEIQNTGVNDLETGLQNAISKLMDKYSKSKQQQPRSDSKPDHQPTWTKQKAQKPAQAPDLGKTAQKAGQTGRQARSAIGKAWQRGKQIADKYVGVHGKRQR